MHTLGDFCSQRYIYKKKSLFALIKMHDAHRSTNEFYAEISNITA